MSAQSKKEIRNRNLAAVRAYFETHLCATQSECAQALGISPMAVNRHVRTIRNEWRLKERIALCDLDAPISEAEREWMEDGSVGEEWL